MGLGPACLVGLADELWLHPQGIGYALFVRFDADGGGQRHDLCTLGHGSCDLIGQSGHVLNAAAINAGDLLRAQTDGTAGDIHSHIAAADDHHFLAGEIRHNVITDGPEHLHGGHDVLAVLTGNAGLFILMGADGNV